MLLKLIQSCFLSFCSFCVILGTLGIDVTTCHPLWSSKLHITCLTFRPLSSLNFIFVYSLRDILIVFSFSFFMHDNAVIHSGFHLFSFTATEVEGFLFFMDSSGFNLCRVLEKEMTTQSTVLVWRIPGTGSLVGCCHGVTQSRTQLKRLSSSSSIFSKGSRQYLFSIIQLNI